MVEDDQDLVGESHDGFLLAATARDAVVEGREIVVFRVCNRPGDLCQHASQIGVALGGLSREALAAALFVARTDSRPGGQVLVRREATHVGTDLSHDGCRGRGPYARETLRE